MTPEDNDKTAKITLDIEPQAFLDIVSKGGKAGPISDLRSGHELGGEDLRKAWFNYMLISMEKLSASVENIRSVDLINVKKELKYDIDKVEKKIDGLIVDVKEDVKDIKNRVEKADDELKEYKKEVITPLNNKVITLWVKVGMLGVVGGFLGSGILGILFYVAKEYFFKPTITGGS